MLGCRDKINFFCAFFVLSSLSGCVTVNRPAAVKNETALISSKEEVQLGRGMSEEIIKKTTPPLNDPAQQRFVNQVGQKIAQVCERRELMYHFMVLDNEGLNAFALPGGYVYIYRGLLEKIDEPELAAILAHEVGHIEARHSVKYLQSALGYDVLLALALAGLRGLDPALAREIGGLSKTVYELLSRGYGLEDESLADHLAVTYLSRAGYDPGALVRTLELLNERGLKGRSFEISSDQPRMKERIKRVKEEIAKTSGDVV